MLRATDALSGIALLLAAVSAHAATATAKYSIDKTTVGDLMADPAAKAILDKDLPGLTSDARIEQAKGMTLKDIEPYSEGKIDDAALAKVQKDFDALPAGK